MGSSSKGRSVALRKQIQNKVSFIVNAITHYYQIVFRDTTTCISWVLVYALSTLTPTGLLRLAPLSTHPHPRLSLSFYFGRDRERQHSTSSLALFSCRVHSCPTNIASSPRARLTPVGIAEHGSRWRARARPACYHAYRKEE